MHRPLARPGLLLALVALVGAVGRPARADEAITRADVALALVRFERALSAAAPSGDELARVNQAFDRATLAFFAGDRRGTLRQLDALTLRLLGRETDPVARAAIRLRLRIDPPRGVAGTPARLLVTPLYPLAEAASGQATVRVVGGRGEGLALDANAPGPLVVALPPDEGRGASDEVLSLALPGDLRLEATRRALVARDLVELRSDLAGRLSRLPPTSEQASSSARECFAARLRLLSPVPDEEDTTQLFLQTTLHAAALEAEWAALEAGQDPYRGQAGDQWRALRSGDREVPYRVQAPAAALASGRALPLLIAFHGFQGDENMFRWAYGGGTLFELAEAEGWLLCTPRTEPFLRDPALFDRLLEELADDYPIDRRRVFLLGHSMGSQAVALLAQRRASALAGLVLFSGGAPAGGPPALSIRGALDPMGGFGRRADGPGARTLEGWGHTLVVGPHLKDAFAFLRGLGPRRVYY